MDMFTTFVGFAFDPVSIEVFEDSIEVFCCLCETIPLFGIIFQQVFILIVLRFLFIGLDLIGGYLSEGFEVFVEIYYQVFVQVLSHQISTCNQ
jgi:hypothetical protein